MKFGMKRSSVEKKKTTNIEGKHSKKKAWKTQIEGKHGKNQFIKIFTYQNWEKEKKNRTSNGDW